MDSSDGRAFAGGDGASSTNARERERERSKPSGEETLEYIGELVVELRELAQRAGAERLATLLALAQYEVRGELSKVRRLSRP